MSPEVGKTVTNYDKRPGEAQGFYIYDWFPKRRTARTTLGPPGPPCLWPMIQSWRNGAGLVFYTWTTSAHRASHPRLISKKTERVQGSDGLETNGTLDFFIRTKSKVTVNPRRKPNAKLLNRSVRILAG